MRRPARLSSLYFKRWSIVAWMRLNNLKAVTYLLRIRYEITSDSWATPASVVVRTNSSK
jgi:hypothetical protein